MGGCASVPTEFKKGDAPAEPEEQTAVPAAETTVEEVKEENTSLGTLLKEGEGEDKEETVEELKKEIVEGEEKKDEAVPDKK